MAPRGRLACSTTAPRRSAQPPNAIAQSANQAHPSVSPATTSDTQCRSSSTRLQATATASPTATPARIARALDDRRRPGEQRQSREQRGRRRRMAARERGAEVGGQRIDGRARSVDDALDGVGDERVPERYRQQEHRDPAVRHADPLDDADDDRDHDHPARRCQGGDRVQEAASGLTGVVLRPAGGSLVQIRKRLAVVDQHHQQRDHHAGQAQHEHRQRQGQAGQHLRVEAAVDESPDRGMGSHLIGDRTRRLLSRRSAQHRARDRPRDQARHDRDDHQRGYRQNGDLLIPRVCPHADLGNMPSRWASANTHGWSSPQRHGRATLTARFSHPPRRRTTAYRFCPPAREGSPRVPASGWPATQSSPSSLSLWSDSWCSRR